MTVFLIIAIIIFLILTTANLIFMMAIWRAIMGKSSVDSKLGVAVGILAKSIDRSITTTDKNSGLQGDVAKQIKELTRELSKNGNKDSI